MPSNARLLLAGLLAASLAACAPASDAPPETSPEVSDPPELEDDAPPVAPAATPAATLDRRRPATTHEGGALARAVSDDALYLADEDHALVRRIALPLDVRAPPVDVKLPGRPAQVLALDGRVLVSIRDPGLLLMMRPDADAGLVEVARVAVPPDAWGIALTPDERVALVSSAWSHKVSAVDVATAKLLWTVDVAREPRAIVARPDGAGAYVTHLVGADLTRIDWGDGAPPVASRVVLPAAPVFEPTQKTAGGLSTSASLGYAAALSPEGDRLFVARHALSAVASWREGRPTVDVLLTAGDAPLTPPRRSPGIEAASPFKPYEVQEEKAGPLSLRSLPAEQPRAMVFRATTRTLLVVGEKSAAMSELDARSLVPSLSLVRTLPLASAGRRCGAPSGIALSTDETYAWVWCRTTDDLSVVALAAAPSKGEEIVPSVPVETAPFDERTSRGRTIFFDHCARCHAEGRDDGHVWHEHHLDHKDTGWLSPGIDAAAFIGTGRGVPRQTPMLAGRVDAKRPYGWRGNHVSLEQHVTVAFAMHGGPASNGPDAEAAADDVVAYLRKGLVTPPKERRALSAEEARGEEVFNASDTRCWSCHFSGTGYTDRAVVPFAPAPRAEFDAEDDASFKTPSLLYVGGTAPYMHDGRFATLDELIEKNRDHMGHTSQLSRADRAALRAFLETLGTVEGAAARDEAATRDEAAPAAVPNDGEIEPLAPLGDRPSARGSASYAALTAPTEGASPPPSWPEWTRAEPVALPRIAPGCRLYRVREWFRAHCDAEPELRTGTMSGAGRVALLVGARRGVELTRGRYNGGADAVFPMHRGDARVFELNRVTGASRCIPFWDVAAVVSASWLPGEEGPTVVVQ
jgi:mono/diheme cytochrome c family protein